MVFFVVGFFRLGFSLESARGAAFGGVTAAVELSSKSLAVSLVLTTAAGACS